MSRLDLRVQPRLLTVDRHDAVNTTQSWPSYPPYTVSTTAYRLVGSGQGGSIGRSRRTPTPKKRRISESKALNQGRGKKTTATAVTVVDRGVVRSTQLGGGGVLEVGRAAIPIER